MTEGELDGLIARLRSGVLLSVRSPEGWWGVRAGVEGLVRWSRIPYEPDPGEVAISEEELRRIFAGWPAERVWAALSGGPSAGD